MIKISAEAQCPNRVYEEHLMKKKLKVTEKEWMEFTDPKKKEAGDYMLSALIVFISCALIVFAWESGISFKEMLGVFLVGLFTIGGVASIFYFVKGN